MVEMSTVVLRTGGGGGGMEADTSDDLEKMGRYEKAFMTEKVFKFLSELEVVTDETKIKEYNYIVFKADDFPGMEAKSMGAAGHKINSQIAVLGIPYRAVPFSTDDAPTVTKIISEEGKPDKKKVTSLTDALKVSRVGEEFDPTLYAVPGYGKTNSDEKELVYEKYTKGQEKRAIRWLNEVGVEFPEILEKMGIAVEEVEE